MKFIELKENEPLEIIEVTNHVTFTKFPDPLTGKIVGQEEIIHTYPRIQMKVFTDGEIEIESKETIEKIDEYYLGKTKYKHDVDTLKTKNIYFKNHSFVIVYLISNEITTIGNTSGWFNVIKDVQVYLRNKKDKQALKNAKQALKTIHKINRSIDSSTIFGILFYQEEKQQKYVTEKIGKNIYSLKKRSKIINKR